MKEALCWEKVMESAIKCNLCMRKCLISEGQMGWCQTRINQNGVLYTLTYGHVASISVSPIEKRQMYHFFPGTTWLFLGGLGCNFRCRGCHSWEFSHCDVKKMLGKVGYMSPELVVTRAKKNGCKGIAFTFNEPTVWFEYTLDVFKLAK
ncbi:MAG: AmmeMemoRadiSam system radical SAM enzyme, partial [Candidatus Omnitrophica bacterium]|nr:AmmeMemoRadiSam system radical SAM enzyme [Candidatus Omnitrophota bacterium]